MNLDLMMYKINQEAYVINLIGTHWIALYVNGDNITYLHNFVVK